MEKQIRSALQTLLSGVILCAVLLGGCSMPTAPAPTPATSFQDLVSTEVSKQTTAAAILPTPFVRDVPLATPVGKIVDPTEIPLPALADQSPPVESIFGASVTPADDSGGLKQISQIGLKWTRIGLQWQAIEPVRDQLDWSQAANFEGEVKNSVQAGVHVVGILLDTPAWAVKPGFSCGVIHEDLYGSFARFASEAVQRYSQPPYNIKYWEIYNEPDAPGFLGCWGDKTDHQYYGGENYGRMLQSIYPAMKAADPNAQVLVGGLLMDCDPNNPPDMKDKPGVKVDCTSGRFFEGILAAGAVDVFDGVAFHSYDYYAGFAAYFNPNWNSSRVTIGSSAVAKAAYLRGLMEKYGVKDRYLVNTEFAVFCGREGTADCDPIIDKVEATKAFYAVQFMATSLAENYKIAIWYTVLGAKNNALLNKDLSPKPAFYAMDFTNKMIGQTRFIQTYRDFSFVVHEFQRAGEKIWVVWTQDNQNHTLDLPSVPAATFVIGPDGKAHETVSSKQITLDVEPAFIVFPNP